MIGKYDSILKGSEDKSCCPPFFRTEQRMSTCHAVDKTFYLTAARMLRVLVAVIALIHHLISGTDQSHNERAPGC